MSNKENPFQELEVLWSSALAETMMCALGHAILVLGGVLAAGLWGLGKALGEGLVHAGR